MIGHRPASRAEMHVHVASLAAPHATVARLVFASIGTILCPFVSPLNGKILIAIHPFTTVMVSLDPPQ